ncbi:hypothetical protein ACP4OV_031930 [Aristida adscensionis]
MGSTVWLVLTIAASPRAAAPRRCSPAAQQATTRSSSLLHHQSQLRRGTKLPDVNLAVVLGSSAQLLPQHRPVFPPRPDSASLRLRHPGLTQPLHCHLRRR